MLPPTPREPRDKVEAELDRNPSFSLEFQGAAYDN
jgi:hypothetical protein